MSPKDNNSRLVYSSEQGRICPECGQASDRCRCKQQTALAKGDGIVRIQRESKGRKGKGVTLITGIPLSDDELKKLAKNLKQKCGTGGTIKNVWSKSRVNIVIYCWQNCRNMVGR